MGDERNTPEAWAAAKDTPRHILAGAARFNHWAAGEQVTEAEYDAGLKKAGQEQVR